MIFILGLVLISSVILSRAWMTVVWSRPPKTFHVADVGGRVFRDELRHFVGQHEFFVRGFHFQDGDARLHIGRLDVHSEPPRKTGAQPLFEGREVLRGAVGSDDDLLVRLIKVVEDVGTSL